MFDLCLTFVYSSLVLTFIEIKMNTKYTVRVVARKNKLSKITGEIPICIRTTKDRKSTYVTLFSIKPEYWDEQNRRVKKSHPNSNLRNNQIVEAEAKYNNIAYKAIETRSEFGVGAIRDRIKNKVSYDYIEYVEHQISELYKRGNISMYKRDKCVIDDFKKFLKKESLPLNQFTTQIVKDFDTYLIIEKKNQCNTVTGKMKRLRKYANDLFNENNLDIRDFPFRNYKMKSENNPRNFLTEREFKKLLKYKKICTPINPLRDSLNLFLIECFTGLRISDILTLRWKHYQDGSIQKKMEKTKDTILITISEVPLADSIIEERYRVATKGNKELDPDAYIFNILKEDVDKVSPVKRLNLISAATAKINKDLKELAKKTNIKKNISTHIGRHTFATRIISGGYDVYTVSKMLGHKDVRTTQIYAQVTQKKQNEALRSLNR